MFKSFGLIEVLNDISLEVHAGEVLCLQGDKPPTSYASSYMLARKASKSFLITHHVVHALNVGDHFAVLMRGCKAGDF